MKFLTDIYRLAYIKRYSNIPRLKEESVAEHGFFVAAIVMELHSHYTFDLGEALAIAVSHDMPEMELNDCPVIIKKEYPQIQKAFDDCERQVAEQLPKACRDGVLAYDAQETVEAKMVKLADAVQCLQYSEEELKLGNTGYMATVYINSEKRINTLKEEFKQYER